MKRMLVVTAGVLLAASTARAQGSPDSWSLASPRTATFGAGGAVVAAGADQLYLVDGGGTRSFHVLTISTGEWTTLPETPLPVLRGGAAGYCSSRHSVFLTCGEKTQNLYEYDIATGSWAESVPLPSAPNYPERAHLAVTPSRVYFVNHTYLWMLDLGPGAEATWVQKGYSTTLYMASLCYPGWGDHLYATWNTMNFFQRYSISGENWEFLYQLPFVVQDYAALIAGGPEGSVYFLGKSFLRYDVAAGVWTPMPYPASAPDLHSAGASSGGTLFIAPFAGGNLLKFATAAETWEPEPVELVPVTIGPLGACVAAGRDLYVLRGPKTPTTQPLNYEFWRYSLDEDRWTRLKDCYRPAQGGCSLAWPGGDHLYGMLGSGGLSFARYSIAADAWESMATPPRNPGYGARAAWGGDRLYAISDVSGGAYIGAPCLMAYTLPDPDLPGDGGRWELLAALPGGAVFGHGADLTWPGFGGHLYVLRGGGGAFLRWSMAAGEWEVLPDFPAVTGDGSGIVYPGCGASLYALEGGGSLFKGPSSPAFWSYSLVDQEWTRRADAPGLPAVSGGLVVPAGEEAAIFAVPGAPSPAASCEIWRYEVPVEPLIPLVLTQRTLDGIVEIPAGGTSSESGFSVRVRAPGAQLRIQLEVRPLDVPFSGAEEDLIVSDGYVDALQEVTLAAAGLAMDEDYHWQIRLSDRRGGDSGWIPFGATPVGIEEADIRLALPAASSGGSGGGCGGTAGPGRVALGIAAALLALAGLAGGKVLRILLVSGALLSVACGGGGGGGGDGASPATPVRSLEILPGPATIPVGATATFEAVLVVDGTPGPAVVSWLSTAPEKAAIDATGTATGISWGSTRIQAWLVDGSGLHASVELGVGDSRGIYGVDAARGVLQYDDGGGAGQVIVPLPSPIDFGAITGAWHDGRWLYLGYVNRLVRMDPDVTETLVTLDVSQTSGIVALVGDRQGRVLVLTTWGTIHRYDPATKTLKAYARTGASIPQALAIDSQDRLYVHDVYPGDQWTHRVDPMGDAPVSEAGTPLPWQGEPCMANPFGVNNALGGGLAVSPDGKIHYVADFYTARIYRGEDGPDAGVYIGDAEGEILPCTPQMKPSGGDFWDVWGICHRGPDLLVNLESTAVMSFQDGDDDGIFDLDEQSVWAPKPLAEGAGMTILSVPRR